MMRPSSPCRPLFPTYKTEGGLTCISLLLDNPQGSCSEGTSKSRYHSQIASSMRWENAPWDQQTLVFSSGELESEDLFILMKAARQESEPQCVTCLDRCASSR
jgi:hypothetical protein